MKIKILVVDDEPNIIELLKMNLESSGYEVLEASTGMEAITKTNLFSPDLVLLDLMLPDIDGLQVCGMLKKNHITEDIPIIMITAKSEEVDKVQGLTIGADDYITKPFGISELEARIKTVLRRSDKKSIINEKNHIDGNTIFYDDLKLDKSKYEITQQNIKLDLTLTEYIILKSLIENGRNVSSRKSILGLIGSENNRNDSRTLDVHIRNIRKKLSENKDKEYIETVRGIGYKLK